MRGSTDAISAALPAPIPPVTLSLLQSYLKFVNNVDAKIILLDGRIRESEAGKFRELQSLTSIPSIGFIDTRNQSLLSSVKCSGLSGIFWFIAKYSLMIVPGPNRLNS
jgi:hypothetical protein